MNPPPALRIVCTDRGQHERLVVAYLRETYVRRYAQVDEQSLWAELVALYVELEAEDPEAMAELDLAQQMTESSIGEVPALRRSKQSGRTLVVGGDPTAVATADSGTTYRFRCPRCRRDEARRVDWVEQLVRGASSLEHARVDMSYF